LDAPDTCWLARVLTNADFTIIDRLAFANRTKCRACMQPFHSSKSSKMCIRYLECCHLLVLMLAEHECDCLVVSLKTEVVLSLFRAQSSEMPDHDIGWIQVNSYAGMQLLRSMACSQLKD